MNMTLLKKHQFLEFFLGKKMTIDHFNITSLLAFLIEVRNTNPELSYDEFHKYITESVIPKVIGDIEAKKITEFHFTKLTKKHNNLIVSTYIKYSNQPIYNTILHNKTTRLPTPGFPSLDFEAILNLVWEVKEASSSEQQVQNKQRKEYFIKITDIQYGPNGLRLNAMTKDGIHFVLFLREPHLSIGDCILVSGFPKTVDGMLETLLNSVILIRNYGKRKAIDLD